MNDMLKENIAKIPFNPGIYLMKDKDDNVIYVGKAISLKKRVKQYFQKSNKTERIKKMVTLIDHIEYIICQNEVEALMLECNYIKEYMPKFNVLLKDDKMYPYIKVTINEKYPSIFSTRQKKEDGSKYFGPYADIAALREVLLYIKQIFPVKRCKYDLRRKNASFPCLYYHIGKCLGPCINDINAQEYSKMIKQICSFLEGKNSEIIKELEATMQEHIEKLEFEKASKVKEKIDSITTILEKQKVANINENDTDIASYIYDQKTIYFQIFKIRNNRIIGNEKIRLNDILEEDIKESINDIIVQYYCVADIPSKIYIKEEIEDIQILQDLLTKKSNKKVQIIVPKKGDKQKLITMVENNILINLEQEKSNVLLDMTEFLKLDREIATIECYDISNLRNEYIVGAMIRYEDNALCKAKYRKFKIRSTLTQNDPLCMYEVLSRRLNRKDEWELPDVLLIDGGKTQLEAVKQAIKEANIDILVYGMVKDNRHRTRGLIDINGNEIILETQKIEEKRILNFITFLQDEVHRFVIRYHRSLRDKIIRKK